MKAILPCLLVCVWTLSACAAQQPQAPMSEAPVGAPQPAEPSTQPTGAAYSQRLVRITHAEGEDLFERVIEQLHAHSTVAPILQRYGLRADATRYVTVEMQEHGRGADVQIVVDLREAPAGTPMASREIADALVGRLRDLVRVEAGDDVADQLRVQMEKVQAEAQAQMDQARADLASARQKLREQIGRSDASVDRIRDELAQLEDRREELQLELEAKAARVTALSENIAKMANQIEAKVLSDEVAKEFEKVVDAKQRQVEQLSEGVKAGHVSRADLDDAIAQLAEARARLLERRAEALSRAGGDTVNEWNRELMALSVDSAELQARLQKMTERLMKYQSVAAEIDQIEAANDAREQAQEVLQETRERLRDLQTAQQASGSVRATVIRSEDRMGERDQR